MATPAKGEKLDLHAIRRELHICESFSAESFRTALDAVSAGVTPGVSRVDRTGIPLFTIDPAGSVDLDQALWIEEVAGGSQLRLYYAIADVGAYVSRAPDLEAEAWKRGVTAYSPDARYGVYPPILSESGASLLADGRPRPAFLFTADVDCSTGNVVAFDVERAEVLSRRRMSYVEAQAELDSYGCLRLMERLGRLRQAHAARRGSAQIDLPSQRAQRDDSAPGGYANVWDERLPIEDWNAELSLLVGMGSAELQISAGCGLLRVMSDPAPSRVHAAHAAARTLGLAAHWPRGARLCDVVASLHGQDPKQAALLTLLRRCMGGASYVAFEGGRPPRVATHYALAARYAHCTAPLRRLADRYVLEHVAAIAEARRRGALPLPPLALAAAPAGLASVEGDAGGPHGHSRMGDGGGEGPPAAGRERRRSSTGSARSRRRSSVRAAAPSPSGDAAAGPCVDTSLFEATLEPLRDMPRVMGDATQRAGRLEKRIIDAIEVAAMAPRVGETFPASVLWADGHGANILIHEPAVITWMEVPAGAAPPEPGSVLDVRLTGVDRARGYLQLEPVEGSHRGAPPPTPACE